MPIAEAMAEAEKMNATSVDRKHVVLKQQSLLDAWLDQQAQRALIQMKKNESESTNTVKQSDLKSMPLLTLTPVASEVGSSGGYSLTALLILTLAAFALVVLGALIPSGIKASKRYLVHRKRRHYAPFASYPSPDEEEEEVRLTDMN